MRTHVDLFSGIGGFSLASQWNGVQTVAFCEIDQRCRDFLAKAYPGVFIHDDVRTFPSERFTRPWLLTGGVPCQPASRAGKQRGAEDDRWLWPVAVSLIGRIQPRWALLENPPGIGDVGLAGVLSDVESQGYEVQVVSIGACSLNAPHRRLRYWLVAHTAEPEQHGHQSRALRVVGTRQADRPADRQSGAVQHRPVVQGDVADTTEPGREGFARSDTARSQGRQDPLRPESAFGAGDVGNTSRDTERLAQHEALPVPSERDARMEHCLTNGQGHWDRFVWLSCADGKLRRAPDDSFLLVDGDSRNILEILAEEGFPHRSILGALGNGIVWPVAAEIIAAMIESEEA